LQKHGFSIVERNYHTVFGEIDVVAKKGADFYFIEVKTRKNNIFANTQSITISKKRRLEKTVRAYCYSRNIADYGLVLCGLIVELKKVERSVKFYFYILNE
jgi:putative endonuclease